jgi:hypothetical protein
MNIANIFGLHIGCRVKHSFTHDNTLREGISLLTGVQILQGGTIFIEAGFKEYNHQFCKLILKPLSKITDEDKAEFENIMMCGFKFEKVYLYDINKGHPNHKKQWIILAKTIVGTELYVNSPDQILWLCSKGYDIGIVPDEYKEVEE